MKVAVVKEDAPGERRVALVPETVPKLMAARGGVLVGKGGGGGGAEPPPRPTPGTVSRLQAGQAVFGLLAPLIHPELAQALAGQGVTAVSLDGLPRTLSRTQPMDALSSQAN